jgi:hypothetical protein
MKMFDHDPAAKLEERLWGGNTLWTTWAPMLPLQQPDPALGLPAGALLHPQVLLRNTTPRPQTADVKLRWRGDLSNGLLKLPAVQLQPFETHLMDVEALQRAKQIPLDAHWTSVEISSSTAQPDDLIAIASRLRMRASIQERWKSERSAKHATLNHSCDLPEGYWIANFKTPTVTMLV